MNGAPIENLNGDVRSPESMTNTIHMSHWNTIGVIRLEYIKATMESDSGWKSSHELDSTSVEALTESPLLTRIAMLLCSTHVRANENSDTILALRSLFTFHWGLHTQLTGFARENKSGVNVFQGWVVLRRIFFLRTKKIAF